MDIHEKLLGASEEKWQRLLLLGHIKEYESEELIFMQGQPCESLFYVQEGIVKNVMYLPTGKEKILHYLRAPAITGQSGLFDNQGSICSAVAVTKAKCVIIPRDIFIEFLLQNPQVMYKICVDLVYKSRCSQAQAEDVYTTVPKKLARLLLDAYHYGVVSHSPDNMQITLTHNEIASFLGTTRQRVTQYLSEFEKKGFIEKKYNCINVIDYQALSEYFNE